MSETKDAQQVCCPTCCRAFGDPLDFPFVEVQSVSLAEVKKQMHQAVDEEQLVDPSIIPRTYGDSDTVPLVVLSKFKEVDSKALDTLPAEDKTTNMWAAPIRNKAIKHAGFVYKRAHNSVYGYYVRYRDMSQPIAQVFETYQKLCQELKKLEGQTILTTTLEKVHIGPPPLELLAMTDMDRKDNAAEFRLTCALSENSSLKVWLATLVLKGKLTGGGAGGDGGSSSGRGEEGKGKEASASRAAAVPMSLS